MNEEEKQSHEQSMPTTTISSPEAKQTTSIATAPKKKAVATNRKAARDIRFVTIKKQERAPFRLQQLHFWLS